MKNIVLIKWLEKSKVTAQGVSTQRNESVESPQMVKIEKLAIYDTDP
jgi:hypothetical protein